ncbi:hypothetical protein [Bilophila wadsworthia]|uniref:hypothetical protein n=1 Tax=Bilophila wadsworthia TaxID=35833 RepID=UPI00351FBC2A
MKPLRGMAAVYLREMLILRRRILKQFASWLVSPLLYLVAFHYAMNDTLVGSRPYADFLLPGLVAMSSMTQSWAIASDINIKCSSSDAAYSNSLLRGSSRRFCIWWLFITP